VAIGFGFLEPLEGVRFGGFHIVRTGGIVVPLPLDFVFVAISGLDLRRPDKHGGDGG
jgi:hypothetical protein